MVIPSPFPRYQEAIALASELHGDTRRKHWDAPLLAHLVAVSTLVWEDGGDQDQAVAAVLHDALVYGGSSFDALSQRFGARVAEIARFATDTRQAFDSGPRPAWLERRQAHIQGVASLPDDVLLVMVADKAQECQEWSLQLELRPQSRNALPGGLEPMAWYYNALHHALAQRLPQSRSLLILGRSVRDLQKHLQAPSSASQLALEDWLSSYPQRHQPELFH